jgi:hypothetical protein
MMKKSSAIFSRTIGRDNEAPRSPDLSGSTLRSDKLRGIKSEFAEANPPSLFKLRRVRPAIHPCSKLQGILAWRRRINTGLRCWKSSLLL